MLRHSTAPFAILAFLISACSPSDEAAVVPDPSGEDQSVATDAEGEDTTTPNLLFALSSSPDGQTPTATGASKPGTLAEIPENQAWTLLARSPDGQGGFIGLNFTDNGNGDSEHFTYNEETGVLTLVKPVDFERPRDADRDNTFELQMIAYEYPEAPPIDFALDVLDQKEIFEDHPVVWVQGEERFGGLGRNVTPLGDLNGDGLPDLAMAAPGRHHRDQYEDLPPTDYYASGDVYFVSGEVLSETTSLEFAETSGPGIIRLSGADDTLNLGYNMTLIGDLDGDEVEDFLLARDDHELHIISGATLVELFGEGGTVALSDVSAGAIRLEEAQRNHKLDPRTFVSLGDLDGDDLSEVAFCTNNVRLGSNVEANVFTLSGSAMKQVLEQGSSHPITDFYETSQAAYYSYLGNHAVCGPLTALGDVDGDKLMDIAIPMPGPGIGDSGILVFGGAQLLYTLQKGGRVTVSRIDKFFKRAIEPFVHFTDNAATGTEQHLMVNALGDVSGDGIDDFSFGWGRYLIADDSAYIVNGAPDLLAPLGETRNLRGMITNGGVVQLAATLDNLQVGDTRVEHVHALRALEDGLHETLVFVGAGESRGLTFDSFVLSADQLPDGGTSIVPLPIAGAGKLSIPRGNRRLQSYVTTVGDLNTDGYADMAIGWGTFDVITAEDGGVVMLVSGKELVEANARGETFRPHTMLKVPE